MKLRKNRGNNLFFERVKMFNCIACSKQAASDEENEQVCHTETVTRTEGDTPPINQVVKSLTSQLKDMALKFTGAYKKTRSSGAGPSTYRRGPQPNDYDNNSEGVQDIGGNQTPRRNEPVAAYATEVRDGEEDITWTAHVDRGVYIIFAPLSTGGNDLRKIQFNRHMFDRWQAQQWWSENFDRIMELYDVQRIDRQALSTPRNSERDAPPISRQPSGRDSPV